MEKFALIYIGGNTIRYALWQIQADQSYILLESYREDLKLGQNTHVENIIKQEKIEHLLTILKHFKEFSNSVSTNKTLIVLSEFFQRIENTAGIEKRILEEIGDEIISLTCEEELHYDYLALSHSMNLSKSLIVDISGVSTQIGYVDNGILKDRYHIPVGPVSLTEKFNLENLIQKENHIDLEKHLIEEIRKIPWLKSYTYNDMVIVGGSARAISKIDRKKRRYPLDIIHEYTMENQDIHWHYKSLITKNLNQRIQVPGLDKDRADILPSALAIVDLLLQETGIEKIRVSGSGIREGFLLEHIHKKFGILSPMLEQSISNILSRHSVNKTKSKNLFTLTSELYQSLNGMHKDWKDAQDILFVSSRLRDVGLSVRYYNHDKHNFYIIVNSELRGLDHRQIILCGLAATFTNGIHKEAPLLQYGQIINRMDLEMVYDIGICLSLAERLLQSDHKELHLSKCSVTEDTIELKLLASDDIHFELHDASKLSPVFHELYRKNLILSYEKMQH